MLRVLIEKVGNMQEHMGNIYRKGKIFRKNQKEMLELKNLCNRNKEHLSWAH